MDLARQTQLANILRSDASSASAVSIGSNHKRSDEIDPRFEEDVSIRKPFFTEKVFCNKNLK